MSRFLVAAALATVLACVVAEEIASFVSAATDPSPARPAATGPVRGANLLAPDPPEPWVVTALERPLFRENRRPPEVASGAAGAEAAPRLTGVLTGPFGNRAIFMAPGESKPIVVAEGGRVRAFVVRSIIPNQAIVETEGGLRTLRPAFAGVGPSAHP